MKRPLCIFVIISCVLSIYAQRAEDYETIAEDGAWCWFSDPRSVFYSGDYERTYTGYVTSKGDIMVSYQELQTEEIVSHTIYKGLQVDDHVNPSLLFLPDGRLKIFFTRHNGTIYHTTTKKPEDISSFEPIDSLDYGKMLCYTNPVLLSEESNRIYLFFRGGYDWKPSFIISDDLGKTWSKSKSLVSKKDNNIYNRPYTKITSDGKSNIHFAFTDGHPREENQNSIYYLRYAGGFFFDAGGNKIGDVGHLPIQQELIPKAYDGVIGNQRAWIWDIAMIVDDQPVIVYSVLPEETMHYYHYGIWNGTEWVNTRLCKAGNAFPRIDKMKEERDPEPHYSGGIVLDHEQPNIVYLSRPYQDRFEIEKWMTEDGGKTFAQEAITSNSLKDNIRPVVVRNAPISVSPRVLWMHVNQYEHYTNYNTEIKANRLAEKYSTELSEEAVLDVMKAVADWQIDNFHLVKHAHRDWTNGALYAGMMEWAKIAPDQKYIDWLYELGRKYAWQPFYRMYHADDLVVSQMYLEMYLHRPEDENRYLILGPTQARLDYVIMHPSQSHLLLDYSDPKTLERWSWCDALFMAPPVYAKMANITGDEKYLSFMDQEFKQTYEFLYDKEEHLFYRDHRYFPKKQLEANGEKIFWGRGNGWVMGGLVSLLKELPQNSQFRPFYEQLFADMIVKVMRCQGDEGLWRASMLDPESFPNPETSSSSFFCYAVAYAINAGLLDKSRYKPLVLKSWQSLVKTVHADGKLGWVQPIGENPKNVTADMTEVYGVGAFLLAGTEVLKLIEK